MAGQNMMRWIILDRDGVINEDADEPIQSPNEWIALPDSLEAIGRLSQAGFHIAVLTNQPGIARGQLDPAALARVHDAMRQQAAAFGGQIDAILVCPHGPEHSCDCRTPRTGLYRRFAEEHGADLRGVPAVTDSLRGLQAAESVGAEPILVETGKGQKTLRRNPNLDVQTFVNLYEAAQYILFTQG
jgi:D-glycero-D-manno-heptose 1,7-bisphosphate phosphatase